MNGLIVAYFFLIGVQTLYNPKSILPFCLVVMVCISMLLIFRASTAKLKVPKLSVIDLLLLAFLVLTLTTANYNFTAHYLNLNHLIAYYSVIPLYYFTLRWALANSKYRCDVEMAGRLLHTALLFMLVTAAVDYLLLTQGINAAEYLPMESANRAVGIGLVIARPRGFMPEPTDLGLALNSIGPIVLGYLYSAKQTKAFHLTFWFFLIMQILTRSASAFVGLFVGIVVALLAAGIKGQLKFRISRTGLIRTVVVIGIAVIVAVNLSELLTDNFANMLSKISMADGTGSGAQRADRWLFTLSLFCDADNPLIGYGTGYMSGNHDTSYSWLFSVLVENGILGFMIILMTVFFTLVRISLITSKIKYGFYISLISVFVHLTTQTGFYLPFLWLILVLAQMPWPKSSFDSIVSTRKDVLNTTFHSSVA